MSVTLRELPWEIEGISKVEWLIIDDGSTDNTVEVAIAHGVNHVVRHTNNLGLARAFSTGINACIQLWHDPVKEIEKYKNALDLIGNIYCIFSK